MSSGGDNDPFNKRSLCNGIDENYSLGLHVGAIIVVLFSSILGTLLPIITTFIPFLQRHPFVFVVGKTAATGVLLSVSTIHLTGDAIKAFEEPCVPKEFTDFYGDYALLFAIVAALLMHLVDFQLGEIATRWLKQKEKSKASQNDNDNYGENQEYIDTKTNSETGLKENILFPEDGAKTVHEGKHYSPGENLSGTAPRDGCRSPAHHVSEENLPLPGCGHTHEISPPDDMAQIPRIIAAVCMEFGVTLHSVFVGLDIGLTTDRSLKPLLIALVFHQLFEGMSLGSRLVDAKFKVALDLVLALVFSVSAPLGMSAATIAVSVRKDAMAGSGFVLMMGTLSGLCGGILLYLAFNLLYSDFATEMRLHCAEGQKGKGAKKIAMFVALWFGMILMAIIGKWC